jgi:hypothetical protein
MECGLVGSSILLGMMSLAGRRDRADLAARPTLVGQLGQQDLEPHPVLLGRVHLSVLVVRRCRWAGRAAL